MSIKSWPKAERPREKLLAKGVAHLSDAELLAILLRVGVKGTSAVALGRELIQKHQTLGQLFALPLVEFTSERGLGVANFAQFTVVKEVAKRILLEELKTVDVWQGPEQVRQYLRLHLANLKIEQFVALFLNQQNQIVAIEVLSEGTVNQNMVYIREVVKRALNHHATGLIVAHNHPSGGLKPSTADLTLTRRLAEALLLVDVVLLDHFIVSPNGIMSFQEEGYWPDGKRASKRGSVHEGL
ncbi:MAG: DNA repair protein RadC [Neisseriaceae bacterium]|nr:DNA repair protein RadC [Neisseriaceae bacterium]MBP6862693.1 DNA repair protein RadC [Neisseriaceae bacterium]